MIRYEYHDAFVYDGSDRNYDSTAIRLRQEKWACVVSRCQSRRHVTIIDTLFKFYPHPADVY